VLKDQFSISIENVVASASLNQAVGLESIVKLFPAVEYRPDQFAGLVYRLKRPSVATLVFRTGKLMVAGAKSEIRARRAVQQLVNELRTGGIVILGKPDVTIRNVVASADLGQRIYLEDVANVLGGVIYEPDQFPGLIYRMKAPEVVILIFSSGKLVCTGATRQTDVEKAVKKLHETLASRGLIVPDELACSIQAV
jgi:transcription initiation factor TFIID TATA-box-binding protein